MTDYPVDSLYNICSQVNYIRCYAVSEEHPYTIYPAAKDPKHSNNPKKSVGAIQVNKPVIEERFSTVPEVL